MDKMREEFERVHCGGNKQTTRRNEHGFYVLPSIADAWGGWQSAWQAARQPQERGEAVAREYTDGRWHHGSGFLCMGTLRVARADFDTNPSSEVQAAFFDEMCAVLNAHPAPLASDSGRVAELEAQLAFQKKRADFYLQQITELSQEDPRIAALESQLADRDGEIQRLHKESQMLCDARVGTLEKRLVESREREGRMREVLSEVLAEADDYQRRTGKFVLGWPDRARAALATEKEGKL